MNNHTQITSSTNQISGKSLICKERASIVDEEERNAFEMGLKSKADPVYFISMFSDRGGQIDDYERIFDIYTRAYDFLGTDVKVITPQDLWTFYKSKNKEATKGSVKIYELVLFFIQHHATGHYIIDECPILFKAGK